MDEQERQRERMVQHQLRDRGIKDAAVLEAMTKVPREAFVPEKMKPYAYQDRALPIEANQTISQPYIVALMAAAAEISSGDRVLEIGTGSGYGAAVLSRIADQVYTVERIGQLAKAARDRFDQLGYNNIHVRRGNGTLGWADESPFDAIIVTAGGPEIPTSLKDQLAKNGRLIIPIGESPYAQELVRLRRMGRGEFHRESLGPVRFVPLVGDEGWEERDQLF
jgi:protein-L-isoaspartate(D-aspartate) O-methyltransferase